jgi:hypothetical protein
MLGILLCEDGKEVEARSYQVMKCILCYDNVKNIPNPKTKKKNLVL